MFPVMESLESRMLCSNSSPVVVGADSFVLSREASRADRAAIRTARTHVHNSSNSIDTTSLTTIPRSNLTMTSVQQVDLTQDTARLPLYKGTYKGQTVWYVITECSDLQIARQLGVNFSSRLANATKGSPGLVQQVTSTSTILGKADVQFAGTVDFSPNRLYTPSATGFPPIAAQPGAVASPTYSDLVQIAGTNAVYNAPIVAVGDGPFDVINHTNTHDRVIAIDPVARTVDLLIVRAFAFGQEIAYFSFSSTDAGSATLERSTFVPQQALMPFANRSRDPSATRSAIFGFVNGQTTPNSPPGQGLNHLVINGLLPKEANVQNQDVLAALRQGGDARNVLDTFPAFLSDKRLMQLYSPVWDLRLCQWTPRAIARGLNVAVMDANQVRRLAVRGLLTGPGGAPLGSDNIVVNCPVLAFISGPPKRPTSFPPANQREID